MEELKIFDIDLYIFCRLVIKIYKCFLKYEISVENEVIVQLKFIEILEEINIVVENKIDSAWIFWLEDWRYMIDVEGK